MPTKAPATRITEEESRELTRFREEWLAELERRKTLSKEARKTDIVGSGSPLGPLSAGSSKAVPGLSTIPAASPNAQAGAPTPTGLGTTSPGKTYKSSTHLAGSVLPYKLTSALAIYRQAIEHEQRGEFDGAVRLYRQAFRMDAHVDRAYHNEEMLAAVAATFKVEPATEDPANELGLKHSSVVNPPLGVPKPNVIKILANIMEAHPNTPTFQPEDEAYPVFLSDIPDELILMIVRRLDPTSIESFASVCRKARIITLDWEIWKDLVGAIYKPPQVTNVEDINFVLERYVFDYRRVFVEHPRIRLDGVYIATCHYTRPGLSDNNWVNVTHIITYQRYLRFYLDGRVLSLLANEDNSPRQVIPLLKPTLRMKGLYIGKWRLTGTTIELFDLVDASGRFRVPTHDPGSLQHTSESTEDCRYSFSMTLSLASRPLGRWNKISIGAYNSINLETGDVVPVALKHERPFWFSKVKSYNIY